MTGLLNSDAVDLVLTEGTEVYKENYWLSENNKKGKNARLVLDLGCEKEINGLYIRNTHNSFKHNRGTEGFTLFKANTADGPWEDLKSGVLKEGKDMEVEITEFFSLDEIISTQFIMFQVDSFYGYGGGLHYIAENDAAKSGHTYSSKGVAFFSLPQEHRVNTIILGFLL